MKTTPGSTFKREIFGPTDCKKFSKGLKIAEFKIPGFEMV